MGHRTLAQQKWATKEKMLRTAVDRCVVFPIVFMGLFRKVALQSHNCLLT